jgi:hypothetical protein
MKDPYDKYDFSTIYMHNQLVLFIEFNDEQLQHEDSFLHFEYEFFYFFTRGE